MSTFSCWDPDMSVMEPSDALGLDARSPVEAAEETLVVLLSRGHEFGDVVDVVVQDEAERRYLVTVTFVYHPAEWAEYLGEGGVWRATKVEATP